MRLIKEVGRNGAVWNVNGRNMENVPVKIDVTMYGDVWLCRREMYICEERLVTTVCKEMLWCREIVKKERLLKMKYKRLPSGKHALLPFIVTIRKHLFSYLPSDRKICPYDGEEISLTITALRHSFCSSECSPRSWSLGL